DGATLPLGGTRSRPRGDRHARTRRTDMGAELTVRDLNLHFGGVKVLEDVGFTVPAGQIFGLVGPNGAGKTSLFNCISGHYRPSSGSIAIDGTEILGSPPSTLARHGLARTFQHPALQFRATVL